MKKCFLIVVFVSFGAYGHSGGLDNNGGHNDRKRGGYHCHRDPCFSDQNRTEAALREAKQEARPFTYIYNRAEWKHWTDEDRDCMNTRHEMLVAQASGTVRLSPDGCYVSSGLWIDPYSGKRYTRASELDVDHIIPLKWANDHGGGEWSFVDKEKFANDPINLLVVDDGLNQAKGAQGPSEWMPPNHNYRCRYLFRWDAVLKAYPGLKMSATEQRTMNKMLQSCR